MGAAGEFGKPALPIVGSGVGVEASLLCFKTSCEGWRFNFAKPREKLVKISEGEEEEDLAADRVWFRLALPFRFRFWSRSRSRSRKSPKSFSFSDSEKRPASV